jgi:hypothetical protein
MSLVKKPWLDGIFDDFPVVAKDKLEIAEIIPTAVPLPVATPRKPKTVLCNDFLYCDYAGCIFRHWYRSGYECRKRRRLNGMDKNYEKDALRRALVRLKKTGVACVEVEKITAN